MAAPGGAGLNYFIYGGSQPRAQVPSRGHLMNLTGCEIINGRGKKKKKKP